MRLHTGNRRALRVHDRGARPGRIPLTLWRRCRDVMRRPGDFEERCWRALEVIRKAATVHLAAFDEERTSHDLTEHEWGIVLSTHQNGHFAVIPSETVHVAILMGHGLLRWKALPGGTASSICAELTPKAALLLDEGRWGTA